MVLMFCSLRHPFICLQFIFMISNVLQSPFHSPTRLRLVRVGKPACRCHHPAAAEEHHRARRAAGHRNPVCSNLGDGKVRNGRKAIRARDPLRTLPLTGAGR
jgi:hypothetical protein